MPISNPSEFFRLEEERLELIDRLKNGYLPKATKEATLKELYALDKLLGHKTPNYNSSAFSDYLDGENAR